MQPSKCFAVTSATLLWLLLTVTPFTALRGDIDCPATARVHEPVVAVVAPTDVPDGARLRGSFTVATGLSLPCGDNTFHLWLPPGKHLLRARGVWILTKDVLVDGQTLPVLLDFGSYEYEHAIVVGDPGPDPPPPVPPVPPGERWAVIWNETAERTPQQANLFVALRKEFQSDRLLILDVSNLPPKWEAWRAKLAPAQSLPALMVVSGNQLVRVVPLPSSVSAVKEAIAK
jgi:hypothetical protein